MIAQAKKLVYELLKNDNSGHGIEHIERVYDLAMKFAESENCDKTIVALGLLLHDVDDYKIFGMQSQLNLTNTRTILDKIGASDQLKNIILDMVSKIGFSKWLKGNRPTTIEGMIVSDADMCDAIGANGILRANLFSYLHGENFFDKNIFPQKQLDPNEYTKKNKTTTVNHFFEKILRLKNLMMTKAGKEEALARHNLVVTFLRQFFEEEKAYDWIVYLDEYLKENGE